MHDKRMPMGKISSKLKMLTVLQQKVLISDKKFKMGT